MTKNKNNMLEDIKRNPDKVASYFATKYSYSTNMIYKYKSLLKEYTIEEILKKGEHKRTGLRSCERILIIKELIKDKNADVKLEKSTIKRYLNCIENNPKCDAEEIEKILFFKQEIKKSKYKNTECLKCHKPFKTKTDKRGIPYKKICPECTEQNKKINTKFIFSLN
jgi:hypothetical protein